MTYKVVPFTAQLKSGDTSSVVAEQMQTIIDIHVTGGWEYQGMDTVQTLVAGNSGCFGIGAQPPVSTTYTVLVFRK
ncbi:MAG TPA: hypothetical protein PKA77_16365 [Chitinophagaceae bacterium]|jgi:hypothetical protein|nr:hypothetical protein [Chitinophagaceae bacterium]HMU57278.1 hypothetical protein [Chitinophagaceae bacterium]